MDRRYIMFAFGYGIIGLMLGIYMAASKDHTLMVTHAHIMLAGFVLSFVYAVCHKLWLNNTISRLSVTQFYLHQIGVIVLSGGLYSLYSRTVEESVVGPVLGVASILVLVAMILIKVMFMQVNKNE